VFKLFQWIVDNYQSILNVGLIIFMLSLVPSLATTLRNAKQGIKESVTPMGFFVMIIIIIMFFIIKNYIGKMI